MKKQQESRFCEICDYPLFDNEIICPHCGAVNEIDKKPVKKRHWFLPF